MSLKKIHSEQPSTFKFNDKNLKMVDDILSRYPSQNKKSAVMPLLYLAQKQNKNWIPLSAMKYIAKFLATGIEQRKCISIECGLQNGTLAVFVATQIFDDIAFIVPTATYALVMFLTSIIFVFLLRNTN